MPRTFGKLDFSLNEHGVAPTIRKQPNVGLTISRVSVKASPAIGRRRFHRNTDCVVFGTQACFVLSPFSGICFESGF